MPQKFLFLLLLLCFIGCSTRNDLKTAVVTTATLPNVPEDTEAILKKTFPGILRGSEFGDSIIHYIKTKYNITPDKMLLGVSTCVDDIIFTKNFHLHPEIQGPFHLGGLAGLPFTGTSGLEAMAHHIPEGGTMLLLITPHIGFSQTRGWGYVLRYGQESPSSCCGALMGTLGKLEKGMITPGITEEDYQGGKIGELALAHQKEILEAGSPIIELTKLTTKEAEWQIRAHILDVDLKHFAYIVIITGIIINTDYTYSDYVTMDHFMVYDAKKKVLLEEMKFTNTAP